MRDLPPADRTGSETDLIRPSCFLRISAANIRPNPFYGKRTVSWLGIEAVFAKNNTFDPLVEHVCGHLAVKPRIPLAGARGLLKGNKRHHPSRGAVFATDRRHKDMRGAATWLD